MEQQIDNRVKIFGNLFLISNRLETIGNDFLGELTTKQWFFMATLSTFFKTPPTLSEITEFMGSSRQNVKQIALKLEKKNFIKIEKDEKDARALRIIPTEKSLEYGREFDEKGRIFLSTLFKTFNSQEIDTMSELTDKLLASITEIQNNKNYGE